MKQKIGTIVFIFIIALGALITYLTGRTSSDLPATYTVDSTTIRIFEDSLISLQEQHLSKSAHRDSLYPKYDKPQLPAINRHPFDPNSADSIELLELGFKPWQIRNMLKYRAKGGKWRKPSDMQKIYGVDSAFYATLEPYIQINDTILSRRDTLPKDSFIRYANKKDTIIELNTTDTTELKQICFIGPYVAQKIIWYRDKLGGYCSVQQIAEITDLPPDTYQKIHHNLTANPQLITQLNVNRASVQQFSMHPYIRTEQARQIYTYRRNNIRIKNLDEIKDIFSPEDWLKIKPYLTIE